MKALFLKDWLVLKSQYKFYVLLYLFLGVCGLLADNGYLSAYSLIIMSTVSINLLQADETCRWLHYADITPLSRKTVVKQKYLLQLLLLAATILYMMLFRFLAGLIHGNMAQAMEEALSTACLFVLAGGLMNGVIYPALFRWGTMKGKIISLVFIGCITGVLAMGYVGLTLHWFIGGAEPILPMVALPAAVCLVVLYPLSYLLSVRWYERRELV